MLKFLYIVTAWLIFSFFIGILVGKFIKAGKGYEPLEARETDEGIEFNKVLKKGTKVTVEYDWTQNDA